jgi:hypothetical protein
VVRIKSARKIGPPAGIECVVEMVHEGPLALVGDARCAAPSVGE